MWSVPLHRFKWICECGFEGYPIFFIHHRMSRLERIATKLTYLPSLFIWNALRFWERHRCCQCGGGAAAVWVVSGWHRWGWWAARSIAVVAVVVRCCHSVGVGWHRCRGVDRESDGTGYVTGALLWEGATPVTTPVSCIFFSCISFCAGGRGGAVWSRRSWRLAEGAVSLEVKVDGRTSLFAGETTFWRFQFFCRWRRCGELEFASVALSITAFPVLAMNLAELKLFTTDVGRIAMSAAAVNDVATWILLALAITLSGSDASPFVPLWVLLCGAAFVIFVVFAIRPLLVAMVFDINQNLFFCKF